MIIQAVQAMQAVQQSNFDWTMVGAITAVIGVGGSALGWSINRSIDTALFKQDDRLDKKFSTREAHAEHERRITVLESNATPARRVQHGD